MSYVLEIRKKLESLQDKKYQAFTQNLCPGVENILGIRMTVLQPFAKEISKNKPFEFINDNNEKYFEEIMLKGLVIGCLKLDHKLMFQLIRNFVPKIDNWSVNDSFCTRLKFVKKHQQETFQFLEEFIKSQEVYHIRFALVMLLDHFINDEYIERILCICDEVTNEDYYVMMANAWLLSMCYVKFPKETLNYLTRNNQLDKITYNKALQKIRESNRVDAQTKQYIKSLRRE